MHIHQIMLEIQISHVVKLARRVHRRLTMYLCQSCGGLRQCNPCMQGSSMLQMMPYGWNLTANAIHENLEPSKMAAGRVIRGQLYARMAEMNNCTHHYWINADPHHAFMQG